MCVFKFPHLSMGEKEEWNVLPEHLETSFRVWPRHGVDTSSKVPNGLNIYVQKSILNIHLIFS